MVRSAGSNVWIVSRDEVKMKSKPFAFAVAAVGLSAALIGAQDPGDLPTDIWVENTMESGLADGTKRITINGGTRLNKNDKAAIDAVIKVINNTTGKEVKTERISWVVPKPGQETKVVWKTESITKGIYSYVATFYYQDSKGTLRTKDTPGYFMVE